MSLRPDDTIGTYRVVRRIGAGGTSEVFEVEHTVLNTRHALKVLLPQWVENESIRARFLQEGKLQAEFRHPGLVRVTDTVAEPGLAGLVMDLLEGESVRDRLDREGTIAPKEAVSWILAALEALEDAHAAGIVHRDLKPENLFLEKTAAGDRLRVIDFGIAKGPEGQRTTSRGTLGTVSYMSPEQVHDPGRVDQRTDLFALGSVLWELLVGQPAFQGPTAFASMQRTLEHKVEPPGQRRGGIPGWLDDVVLTALQKKPEARFPSASAFAEALRAGPRGVELPGPVVEEAAAVASSERSGRWFLGIAVLVFGSLVVGIVGITVVLGMAVFFRPPEIHSVYVVSDSCGLVTVDVDARARSGDLAISVDGATATLYPIRGRQYISHTHQATMAQTVFVDVTLGPDQQTQSHLVNGAPAGVAIVLPQSRSEGSVGRTRIDFQGSCLPPNLQWEARIDGTLSKGSIPSSNEVWLDTSSLGQGNHLVEVQVFDGGRTLASSSQSLTIAPPPPPGDLDLDGHASITAGGRDCDDSNPAVHPDMPEAPDPNGVDDNCDGRIDEGTIAYDDDGDGLSEQQGDCNDMDRKVRPGAPELPDCRDQDCDGDIDEGQTLVQREDVFEANDTRALAHDLKTSRQRAFSKDLELVSSSLGDEAWFRFYSQDGDFDDWGIDVTVTQMPANSIYTLEVLDANGSSRGQERVQADGDALYVRGRWLRDDGGDYLLRVRPERLHQDWCPVKIELVAR